MKDKAYAATRNLALIVVVHASSNTPSHLLEEQADFDTSGAIAAVACSILIVASGLRQLVLRKRA